MQKNETRTIPVCFTPSQLKFLEKYAKENGMLNYSQAIESLLKNN